MSRSMFITLFKTMLKTLNNYCKEFRVIIWNIQQQIHIALHFQSQNKLAAGYKTVANSFLAGYSIVSPIKVTNFATYKHDVNNSGKCSDNHTFAMFIIRR